MAQKGRKKVRSHTNVRQPVTPVVWLNGRRLEEKREQQVFRRY